MYKSINAQLKQLHCALHKLVTCSTNASLQRMDFSLASGKLSFRMTC